jgi:threonine dehydratase
MRAVRAPDREEVAAAVRRIEPHLAPTPLVASPPLGTSVMLKLETEQPTGSFKVRGAIAALSQLDRSTPVVAASAGNHALGIAYASARLGVPATVVCAETASPAKLAALRSFRVELVLHGETYDEAEAHALRLAAAGRHYVSAYNDPDVIAGGGTLAVEVLDAIDGPVTIVCPIGGGGLVAGVALWASAREDVRVIGVESEASATMRAALDAGRIVAVDERETIADGLAGNLEPGSVTFELVRRHVSEVVLVAEPEIEQAIRDLHSGHGLVAEGSGAVAAAAILAGRIEQRGRTTVALVTGANIAPELFARVLASA